MTWATRVIPGRSRQVSWEVRQVPSSWAPQQFPTGMALPSSPTCLSASPGKATTSLSPSPTPAMLQPSPPPWRRPSGQTFVGKLLAKTAEGHFEVIQRTGGVSLTSGHQGVPHGQVLAHRSVLMEAVGGCGGCGWPRKSISNTQRSSMPLTPSSSPSSLWVLVALSWMEQFSWIYLPENNLSTIPVDVVISKVSVRYQLAAQVSVVPAGWHLHFVSPGLVVYPENLEIQENSVTKDVQMNVIGWLMAAPQVNPEITGLKYSKMSALS
ncbi:uncharacterized protein LOC135096692 isoform X2 [Scylla paramamosain]|uniref:uncharacterized protein LOC135096692 isoform X2 n=1 Tax=Scylla paramamosain TaxID=85552 RepID=UPI003082B510